MGFFLRRGSGIVNFGLGPGRRMGWDSNYGTRTGFLSVDSGPTAPFSPPHMCVLGQLSLPRS